MTEATCDQQQRLLRMFTEINGREWKTNGNAFRIQHQITLEKQKLERSRLLEASYPKILYKNLLTNLCPCPKTKAKKKGGPNPIIASNFRHDFKFQEMSATSKHATISHLIRFAKGALFYNYTTNNNK